MSIDKETGLSDKQRAFCDFYIANGCNGSQAAKSAGYMAGSERAFANIASKNLKKPAIKEYVEARVKSLESSRIATVDESMQLLTNIIRNVEIGEDGKPLESTVNRIRAIEILLRVNGAFNDKLTVKNEGAIILAGDELVAD